MTLFYAFLYLVGLCIGSFLNVLIYRIPRGTSLGGRSHCPHCRKKIAWYDLIPVVSFLLLKRKCRYCEKPISWRYCFVELLTAGIFVSVGFWWTLSNSTETWQSYLSLGGILCIVSLLIALAFIDAEHMYLPDDIVLPLLVFSVFFSCIRIDRAAMELLAGGLIGLVCFYAIHLLTFKKGFGLGDVKLAGILGTLLGSSLVLWGLYAGVCLATLYSLALMVLKQKTIKDIIPFAPFLVTGTLLVFLFQYPLLQTVNTMFFGNF